jgi:hypothetical protein
MEDARESFEMTQVIRRLGLNDSSYEAFAEWRFARGTRATKTVLLLILFVLSTSVPQAAHGAPSPQTPLTANDLLAASDSHAVGVQAEGRGLSLRACAWGKNQDLQHRAAWTTEFRNVFPLALLIAGDQIVVAGFSMQPDFERRYRPLPGALLRFHLKDGSLIEKRSCPALRSSADWPSPVDASTSSAKTVRSRALGHREARMIVG